MIFANERLNCQNHSSNFRYLSAVNMMSLIDDSLIDIENDNLGLTWFNQASSWLWDRIDLIRADIFLVIILVIHLVSAIDGRLLGHCWCGRIFSNSYTTMIGSIKKYCHRLCNVVYSWAFRLINNNSSFIEDSRSSRSTRTQKKRN